MNEETGETRRAAYRAWSASRDWGTRMADVREAQKRWSAAQDESSLDNNTQSYTADDYEMAQAIAHLRAAGLIDGDG